MKISILVLGLIFWAGNAFGFVSGAADPAKSSPDVMYRHYVKSETAGVSDAVSKGDILSLDVANNNDGGTLTRVGANTTVGAAKVACIAANAVATGNVQNNRCVTRGYVDYLSYDASAVAIAIGSKLCSNAVGAAVVCAACTPTEDGNGDNDCKFGNATESSGITSLEAKSSGTGSDLKVIVNIR